MQNYANIFSYSDFSEQNEEFTFEIWLENHLGIRFSKKPSKCSLLLFFETEAENGCFQKHDVRKGSISHCEAY